MSGWGTWAALALPLLLALALWQYVRRRRRVARALAEPALLRRAAQLDLIRVPWLRLLAVLLAGAALAVALTDPRWGAPRRAELRGATVALVLDASRSMLVRDVAPNRLERERAAARELIRSLRGASVGVVIFAGRAYALSPPTVDLGAIDLYLDALDPEMVTQTGSSLAAAIRQGLGLLVGDSGPGGGAVVLISDGDDLQAEAVLQAAALAGRAGVPIHVLGAGSPAGGPVPAVDFRTGRAEGFIREAGGDLVISRLNEPLLRAIAEASGGQYASLSRPDAVERVHAALASGAGEAGPGAGPAERPARYGWFAGAALLLLAAEGLASAHRRRTPP